MQNAMPPAAQEDGDGGRVERDRKRRRLEDDIDWDPYAADSPQSSGGGEWKPSKNDKNSSRPRIVVTTSGLSTSAPQVKCLSESEKITTDKAPVSRS